MKKIIIVICILLSFCMKTTSNIDNYKDIKSKSNDIQVHEDYGYIHIKKINLNQKFVNNKNVDKNIIMLEGSSFPNENNSILILASHSGTSQFSYFNYLYKLNTGDQIQIIYENVIYNYKIIDIYKQKKDGSINLYKVRNAKTLVLITCTNNNKKYQSVYVSIQID
ncbi:MAG: sortase [bacterium]|nr:sortase [bacterium]